MSENKRLKKEWAQAQLDRDILKGGRVFCQRNPIKYAWIKEFEGIFPICSMCNILQISRSRYYAWRKNPLSDRAGKDQILIEKIAYVFNEGKQKYGATKVCERLVQRGVLISRRRTARLMLEAGLAPKLKRKYKTTTNSNHKLHIAPNLLHRQFNITKPNRVWAGDITHIKTRKGWLYLATVMDLHSRKVVGWSMASHMRAELVNDALTIAIWRRKPCKGLIWHSDRGSQYCSKSHRTILRDHGVLQSMSRKGDCWEGLPSLGIMQRQKASSAR